MAHHDGRRDAVAPIGDKVSVAAVDVGDLLELAAPVVRVGHRARVAAHVAVADRRDV
jgi:hypothetical protein